MEWTTRLGELGVWRPHIDIPDALARAAEDLGYGALWLGMSPGSDLTRAHELLGVTSSVVVATGVVNIWKSDPVELAQSYHRITADHPGRLLVGIGSGHREGTPHRVRPLEATARYLDVLDAEGVPVGDRVISALGPRMTELARTRSAGTHPYLTVPAQTAQSRSALGPDMLVAPEQTVVLDSDPDSARATARAFLHRYLQLSNYTNTMKRAGFTDDDVAGEGSDELIDSIVVHGEASAIVAALRAHRAAGADHVCVQVQPGDDAERALRAIMSAW